MHGGQSLKIQAHQCLWIKQGISDLAMEENSTKRLQGTKKEKSIEREKGLTEPQRGSGGLVM